MLLTEIILHCLGATMEIDVNWIIGIIGILGGTVGTVAGILWTFTLGRLQKQDEIIEHLRDDVTRMSKGCGVVSCVWKNR